MAKPLLEADCPLHATTDFGTDHPLPSASNNLTLRYSIVINFNYLLQNFYLFEKKNFETAPSAEKIADVIPGSVGQNNTRARDAVDKAFDPALMQMTAYQLGTMYFHALKEKNKFGLLVASKFEVSEGLSEAWLDSYPPEKTISMADAAIALREGLAYHERRIRNQLVQVHQRMVFDLGEKNSKSKSEVDIIHKEYLQEIKNILGKEPGQADLTDIASFTPARDERWG